ncbi:zinc finger BED domain-containing protein RICESLEEPER 2 [Tanacetum coccineum]
MINVDESDSGYDSEPPVVVTKAPNAQSSKRKRNDDKEEEEEYEIYERTNNERAPIWQHFEPVRMKNDGLKSSLCKFCNKTLAAHGASGTSSLQTWKHDESRIKKALINMFVVAELPFKFVEHEVFVEYTKACNGRFVLPSRHKLSKDAAKRFKGKNYHVDCVANAIRYIRYSSQRINKFKRCMEEANLESNRFLCGECPTRWNSKHDMLKIVSSLREVFFKYELEDDCYDHELKRIPEHSDFGMCEDVVEFLEKFKTKTELISSSSKPLAHLFYREILDIDKHLRY